VIFLRASFYPYNHLMNEKKRYWELDLLRGMAVIAMVFFHLIFDLTYFDLSSLKLTGIHWRVYAVFWASLFFFIVGICLTISYNRATKKLNKKGLLRKFSLRGIKILGLGLLISLITYFVFPRMYIVFGALHFIGFSIIAGSFLLIFFDDRIIRIFGLPLSILIILVGFLLSKINFPHNWLTWLGITPRGFVSLDYFPIFPWFASVSFGLWFGTIFYPKGRRRINLSEIGNFKSILSLGRHSLPIYLFHQPVLFFLLAILKKLPII